jgi:hypothetical protein
MPDVGIVFGTYNRLPLLQVCISSLRPSVGSLSYEIVVVDGGSSDGTQHWARCQPDVVLIEQTLPLTGAVIAYNLGFAACGLRSSTMTFGVLGMNRRLSMPSGSCSRAQASVPSPSSPTSTINATRHGRTMTALICTEFRTSTLV